MANIIYFNGWIVQFYMWPFVTCYFFQHLSKEQIVLYLLNEDGIALSHKGSLAMVFDSTVKQSAGGGHLETRAWSYQQKLSDPKTNFG